MEGAMTQSRFKRICVFCGSSQGKKSSYQEAAIQLGKELVRLLWDYFCAVLFACKLLKLNLLLMQI